MAVEMEGELTGEFTRGTLSGLAEGLNIGDAAEGKVAGLAMRFLA